MSNPTIDPDSMPSPWWPCPECGWTRFKVACHFERGEWDGDTYIVDDPPSGTPTAVEVSEAECTNCGHVFDIARHYEWPIVGEWRDPTTDDEGA